MPSEAVTPWDALALDEDSPLQVMAEAAAAIRTGTCDVERPAETVRAGEPDLSPLAVGLTVCVGLPEREDVPKVDLDGEAGRLLLLPDSAP